MAAKGLRWRLAQSIEWRWWQQYLGKQEPDHYRQWKTDYWQRLIALADIEIPAGTRVADIGCGPAGVFMVLEGCRVTAVDPLLHRYRALTMFNESDYAHVQLVNSPIETFESDEPFELVFCMNAINHVADLQRAFFKLKELTGAGGTLVLTVDAHNHGWLKRLFRAVPGDVLHPHQHSLEEYVTFIEQQGFTITKVERLKHELIFDHWLIVAMSD